MASWAYVYIFFESNPLRRYSILILFELTLIIDQCHITYYNYYCYLYFYSSLLADIDYCLRIGLNIAATTLSLYVYTIMQLFD